VSQAHWTIEKIDRALDTAGVNATFEELHCLGLGYWPASRLKAIFVGAVRRGEWKKARAAQNALWKHPTGIKLSDMRDIPLRPRLQMDDPRLSARSYLFISGVARSGTTALGRLVGKHADVAMYIELYLANNGYVPEMFCTDNVKMFVEHGILKLSSTNEAALLKSHVCKFVGDKRPGFMKSAHLTLENFPKEQTKVIHVVRNIYDIVLSFEQRRTMGISKKSYKAAVLEANISHRNVTHLRQNGYKHNIIILDYETFWLLNENIYLLLSKLGLERDGLVAQVVNQYFQNASIIREKQRTMSRDIISYINDNYDMATERELRKYAE